MGVRLNTNTAALTAHRVLLQTDRATGRSLERLSSGLRIHRAADDAAGLAISEGLRSSIGGLSQAVRNSQDGVNVIRTAEGALAETTSILQRMRDLSVQAGNSGALGQSAKSVIQSEIDQLGVELTRIATSTAYNGVPLLDGSYRRILQVGAEAGETLTIAIGGPGNGLDAAGLRLAGLDVTGSGSGGGPGAPATITPAVSAEEGVPTSGRLSLAGNYITPGAMEAAYAALSGTIHYNGRSFDLGSVDYTGDVTAQDYIDTINFAARAALGTTGYPVAATSGELVFTGDNPGPGSTVADGQRLSLEYGTGGAIGRIDSALDRVTSTRAHLGGLEKRLEHTIARLGVAAENTSAAYSRIRDADMAQEMVGLARHQVLSQAGTAMLAQANQAPRGLLRLLN